MGNFRAMDAEIARIAAGQHGVIAVRQLRSVGAEKHHLTKRARTGRLHRVHQGVYAVGHAGLSQEGRWMAAVLACRDGAVLSHASAAALWGLLNPADGPVHISVPVVSGRRQRSGIRLHRVTTLAPSDLTRRSWIPVTTPSRTLLDLQRGSFDRFLLRRAIREAQHRKYKLDPRLRADRTRSDLERDFLVFCRRHRIPRPEVNLRVGKLTVDFVWPGRRLAVETDSYQHHQGSVSFEDDHARDLKLRRRGITVLRYTGRQLEDEAGLVAEEVRLYVCGCVEGS
jgi:very-short-patch-repair endonuclease